MYLAVWRIMCAAWQQVKPLVSVRPKRFAPFTHDKLGQLMRSLYGLFVPCALEGKPRPKARITLPT